MNTTSKTYKGVNIYQANDGWRVFISENTMTSGRSLRNIKDVINGSLDSWAVARDGKLAAK